MVNRVSIPISFVIDRKSKLVSESFTRELPYSYDKVLECVTEENNKGLDIINSFMRSCTGIGNSRLYWEDTFNLLNYTKDTLYHNIVLNSVINNIIPNCQCIKEMKDKVNSLSIIDNEKNMLLEAINNIESCDRLLNNYNMINERFNLECFEKGCSLSTKFNLDLEQITESFCSLIDTYNMPLRKKFGVTLELAKYINESCGSADNNTDIVKYIVEYYLKNNPVISDRDYTSIKNTLESNVFLEDKDIINVNYMFTNTGTKLFKDKILEASNDVDIEYKDIIIKIANCKSVAIAKGLIKAAFALIFSTFIITATVPFSTVVILLCALMGLIVTVALSPAVIIDAIRSELKKSEEAVKSLNDREKMKRNNKVYKFTSQIISSIEKGDPVAEAGNLVDYITPAEGLDAPILKDKLEDDGFNFTFLNDDYESFTESEKYADSEDIKDLIAKYKADQDKTQSKLKRLITKIFTKKPEKIIDNLPNIFELIRVFCILSTASIPVVGPGIAIIGIIVDRFLAMTLKREEADRICKYFNKEKAKLEDKYDNMKDGDKKDDLEKYIACLSKSIEKLEDYRDSMFTDKELDARFELDEASMDLTSKITLDQFYSIHFKGLCNTANTAIQFIRNEIIRIPNTNGIIYKEYEYNNVPISQSLEKISANELLHFYTTPKGMVDIPLGKLVSSLFTPEDSISIQDLYLKSIEICAEINRYIDSRYLVTSYKMNNQVVFTLNCFICIGVDFLPEMENTITESAIDMINNIMIQENWIHEFNKYDINNIITEMKASLDIVLQCDDTCEEFPNIIKISGIDVSDLLEELKDYKDCCSDDIDTTYKIDSIIDNIDSEGNDSNDYSNSSDLQYVYQLEAVELLNEIVNEAKALKKSGKTKSDTSLISKAKKTINDKKKEKDNKEKVPISTTVALSAKAAKDKATKISSKEKEISRTIDAYSNTMSKSIKNALTSNRREAIIKGSVIPSFSRIIKAGLAVGAVGIITNPVIAAISALGLFATSKYLTIKEKNLLLDEIEIELEVIEKQLDKCEDNPKKYKQLLTYQRKLQRESQRIRYGLKVKGKDVPDPTL